MAEFQEWIRRTHCWNICANSPCLRQPVFAGQFAENCRNWINWNTIVDGTCFEYCGTSIFGGCVKSEDEIRVSRIRRPKRPSLTSAPSFLESSPGRETTQEIAL